MSDMIERIAETLAGPREAPAIQFKGRWTSWGEVADRARALTTILDDLGLGEGAAIACALRNDPRFIMLVRMIENYTGASVQAADVEAALGADEPLEAPPPAVPPSPARGAEAYASTPAEAPPPPRIDVSA